MERTKTEKTALRRIGLSAAKDAGREAIRGAAVYAAVNLSEGLDYEIIEYLKNLEDYHVKLIITYAKEYEQHRLLHKFDRFGNVEYRAYPNQGYDLG